MKYDISQKQSLGAKRTLRAFSTAISDLIAQKPFESITVREICDACMIPRATFYNYFDDKYDLMAYTLQDMLACVYPEVDEKMDHRENFIRLMENLISYIDKHVTKIDAILTHNPAGSYLYNEIYRFLTDVALRITKASKESWTYIVPDSMVAKRNASSLLIVIEWAYVENRDVPHDEIIRYLRALLNCDSLIADK